LKILGTQVGSEFSQGIGIPGHADTDIAAAGTAGLVDHVAPARELP
jgi:hypothetical protein